MAEQFATKQGQADLARELTEFTERSLPAEKARLEAEMIRTAREARNTPSHFVDGLGQAKASIPPIAYMRWNLFYPGCWKDPAFEAEFLADNPACALNGYKAKAKTLYFDMASGATKAPGARIYHALQGLVGLPTGMKPLGKITV